MKINNWRLVSNLTGFVVTGCSGIKDIYLCDVLNKKFESTVIDKEIPSNFTITKVDLNNEFDGKFVINSDNSDFCEVPEFYIKSNELLDEWYRVKNINPYCYGAILTQSKCIESGVIKNVKVEATFSNNKNSVSFITNEMSEYIPCFEELERALNCDLYKKTKKWIPGHRYDSKEETFIFLEKVLSRRKSSSNSIFLDDSSMVEVYLYVDKIRPGYTTIYDVLTNEVFGYDEYDIKVLYSTKNYVDSGEVLKNNFSKFSDYQEDILKNSLKKYFNSGTESLKHILDVFSYTSKEDLGKTIKFNYRTDILAEISELIKEIAVNYWDIEISTGLGSNKSTEDNVEIIKKRYFYQSIIDENSKKREYYEELFKYFNIPIDDILKRGIDTWNFMSKKIYNNFDYYIDNIEYTKKRERLINCSLRNNSLKYHYGTVTISSKLGEGELYNVIIELLENSSKNLGADVTNYRIVNIGTKHSPKEYVSCEITLDDILKYKKGKSNLSESLKNEIMKYKFYDLYIEFDKDETNFI